MNTNQSLSRQLGIEDALRAFQPGIVVFERFQLVRYLGRSVVNTVWLASDTASGQQVVLKLLPKLVLCDQAGLSHLRSAVQDARKLNHPGIVKTLELLEDDHWAAIVTEPVDGDSLDQIRADRENGVLEPSELKGVLGQIIYALSYATTEANVLHRKITPANLLVDREGIVRITDFGIARVISDCLQRATRHVGTTGEILYLSPQQLDGESPSESDDVYALGATLYELITGKPPFFHGDIIWQIRNETPASLTDRRKELGVVSGPIPKAWEKMVASCLAKDVEDRPQDIHSIAGKDLAPAAPFPLAHTIAARPTPVPVTPPVVDISPVVESTPAPEIPPAETAPAPTSLVALGDIPIPVVIPPIEEEVPKPVQETKEVASTKAIEETSTAEVPDKATDAAAAVLPVPTTSNTATGGLRSDFVPFESRDEEENVVEYRELPRKSFAGPIAAGIAILALLGGGFVYYKNTTADNPSPSLTATEPSQDAPVQEPSEEPSTAVTQDPVEEPVIAEAPPVRTPESTEPVEPAATVETAAPALVAPAPVITPGMTEYERALAEAEAAAKFAEEQAQRAESLRKAAEEKARIAAEKRAAEESRVAALRETAQAAEASAAEKEAAAQELTVAYEALKAEAAKAIAEQQEKVAAAEKARKNAEARALEVEELAAKIKSLEEQIIPLKEQHETVAGTVDESRKLAESSETEASKAKAAAEKADEERTAREIEFNKAVADATEARRIAEEKNRELKEVQQRFALEYPSASTDTTVTVPSPSAASESTPEALAEQAINAADAENWTLETRPVMGTKPAPTAPKSQTPAKGVLENPLGMRFVPVGSVHFSVFETRLQDFEAFVEATKHTSNGSWKNPGFKQTGDHPVVSVTWNDAMAFCKWLTETDRKNGTITDAQVYRLPTDEEWSFAVGLPQEQGPTPEARDMGITNVYPWGTSWPPPAGSGNYTGQEAGSDAAIPGVDDGFMWTAPVGSFQPNTYGLHDMGGNAWEWCMDWWNKDQKARVLRGASWYNGGLKLSLLSSCRICSDPNTTTDNYGFRVVLASAE